jgi:hypothetical protein
MTHQKMTLEEFRALYGKHGKPSRKLTKPPLLGPPPNTTAAPAHELPPELPPAIAPSTTVTVGRPADLLISLPLPPQSLHPNNRNAHWADRKRGAEQARGDAALAARHAINQLGSDSEPFAIMDRAVIHATFILRRAQDSTNLSGWLKSTFDGLQGIVYHNDAGLTQLSPATVIDKAMQPGVVIRIWRELSQDAGESQDGSQAGTPAKSGTGGAIL